MKNKYVFILFISIFILILGACSDDDKTNDAGETNSGITNNDDQEDSNEEDESDSDDENESSTNDDISKIETEDQLDLGIGDTGQFDTAIGEFEITLETIKIIDELDGEKSTRDKIIVLDIALKNISKETLLVENLLESLEITHDLDGSGTSNATEDFKSIEEMNGDLAPGEQITGKLIYGALESKEYYFRERVGNVAAGTTNQVIWSFTPEETN